MRPLANLHAALHATGEGFDVILAAVTERDAAKHVVDAGAEMLAAEAVEMAGVAEVFFDGELDVQRARLEDDAGLLADLRRLGGDVEAADGGEAAGGDHQGGEDAEERGFAGAVGAEQAEICAGATEKERWSSARRLP